MPPHAVGQHDIEEILERHGKQTMHSMYLGFNVKFSGVSGLSSSLVRPRAEALLVAGIVAQPGEHHVERELAHGGRLHAQQAQRGLLQQQRRAQVLLLQGLGASGPQLSWLCMITSHAPRPSGAATRSLRHCSMILQGFIDQT